MSVLLGDAIYEIHPNLFNRTISVMGCILCKVTFEISNTQVMRYLTDKSVHLMFKTIEG